MSSRVRHQPQPPLPSPTHMDRHRLLAEQDVQPAQTPRLAPDRLKQAVFDGDVAAVRQYVVDGANANLLYSESLGASLLFVAAQQGHAEVVDHLLESGARPDARQVLGEERGRGLPEGLRAPAASKRSMQFLNENCIFAACLVIMILPGSIIYLILLCPIFRSIKRIFA